MTRPSAVEKAEWAREAFSVRPAPERHRDGNGVRVERIHAPYLRSLDIPETRLLALECIRKLMAGQSRDRKVELTAWIAQAARSLMTEDFGTLSGSPKQINFERTIENMRASSTRKKAKARQEMTARKDKRS